MHEALLQSSATISAPRRRALQWSDGVSDEVMRYQDKSQAPWGCASPAAVAAEWAGQVSLKRVGCCRRTRGPKPFLSQPPAPDTRTHTAVIMLQSVHYAMPRPEIEPRPAQQRRCSRQQAAHFGPLALRSAQCRLSTEALPVDRYGLDLCLRNAVQRSDGEGGAASATDRQSAGSRAKTRP